jgi:FAD/FMN-containing dehydrogenase/Fe-S oxidoreductase
MLPKLKRLGLDIVDDNLTRQLYATDGSIYQIEPQGVAFPRSSQDASLILQEAAHQNLNIIPRGAGTGLVGGAIGDGLVIDFARHNNQIHSFDRERRIVKVGPGVVLDQLNRFLRPHGFVFGPDVATSSRATIGGMIGNNSSGARVPRYGTTSDHLHALEVVTYEGKVTRVTNDMLTFPSQTELMNELVIQNEASLQPLRTSQVNKRWPGYALHLWKPGVQGWPAIFCGSEGTLAGFVGAELNVVPLPKERALGLIHFRSITEAMQASVALQSLDPTAIEHIDRILLDQTRGQIAFQAARDFLDLDLKPSESILIVEFDHDIKDSLRSLENRRLGTRTQIATTPQEMNLVWSLRKAGLSLLTGCKGSAKPTTGIEDAAIPPKMLPDYVASLQKILKDSKLEACFYGHAASGLLHVRPVIDLHDREDLKRFRSLAKEVSALVRQFKGSLAAEHGVGIARSEFLKDHIDPPLLNAMQQVKRAFDPKGIMNRGKIFGHEEFAIDKNLRSFLSNDDELPFHPALLYAAKDESFSAHLSQCNGCGGCRKETATMCPTFVATGEEGMSTRGRANLIRAALDKRSNPIEDPLFSAEIEHALSNCLGCKACTTECPSNVNLSLLKAELLNARHQKTSIPWQSFLISKADQLGRMGTTFPMLANQLLESKVIKDLVQSFVGISKRRPLPQYANQRFDTWFRTRPSQRQSARKKVLLWDDTFTRYHEPQIGIAAVGILEFAGYSVELVKDRACCGRPAFSQGDLKQARQLGLQNVRQIKRYRNDVPLLFLEPSCFSMFTDDYRELGIEGAGSIAERCALLEDFVFREDQAADSAKFSKSHQPVAIHLHCHCKALVPSSHSLRYIKAMFPNTLILDSGCCGMAGAFGAIDSKYDLSVQIAAPLVASIESLPPETIVLASGTSCRQQISHLTQRPVFHPLETIYSHILSQSI